MLTIKKDVGIIVVEVNTFTCELLIFTLSIGFLKKKIKITNLLLNKFKINYYCFTLFKMIYLLKAPRI